MSDQLDPCGLTYDECASLARTYGDGNQAKISLIVANADRLRANRATPAAAAPQQAVPEGWHDLLTDLTKAMRAYEMAADDGPPYKHRQLMERATAMLAAAPVAAIEQPHGEPSSIKKDEWDTYGTGVKPWSWRIPKNSPHDAIEDAMQAELNELRSKLAALRSTEASAQAPSAETGLVEQVQAVKTLCHWVNLLKSGKPVGTLHYGHLMSAMVAAQTAFNLPYYEANDGE